MCVSISHNYNFCLCLSFILFFQAEAKKTEDAVFQKNNLQRQLREVERSLQQKEEELSSLHKRFTTSHADVLELKMEIDTLKDKLERVSKSFFTVIEW